MNVQKHRSKVIVAVYGGRNSNAMARDLLNQRFRILVFSNKRLGYHDSYEIS